MILTPERAEVFWSYVRKGGPDDCHPWRTYRRAVFDCYVGGTRQVLPVARVAWILTHGLISPDAEVRHDGPFPQGSCCNLQHLYLDDPKERTVNTYVLIDGPSVVGVRTTFPAALRLADVDADAASVNGGPVRWADWSEVEVSVEDSHHPLKAWERASVQGGFKQRVEMHQTGVAD